MFSYGEGTGMNAHPNSLEARSASDPEIRSLIRKGRRQMWGDKAAIERWARSL